MSNLLDRFERRARPRTTSGILCLAASLLLGPASFGHAQGPAAPRREGPVRPIVAWPPGPLEVIVAVDRPLDPAAAGGMVGRTIAYEAPRGVRPDGPGASGPTGHLRIVGARLEDDGRTLVLATDPHPRPARYLLPWPDNRPESRSKDRPGPTLSYDLSGLEAAWYEGDAPAAEPTWSTWWPSLDLDATRRITDGSRRHESGLDLLGRPGRLVLSAWVRLPAGKVTLRIQSTRPIEEAMLGDAQAGGQAPGPDGISTVEMTAESRGEPLFFTATLRTAAEGPRFQIKATYRRTGEAPLQQVENGQLLVPWAPASILAATPAPLAIPDLSGGDPGRGRTLFRGDQARCAQCHVFRGEGGQVGPDLTDIARKGRAEIYRSIAVPAAEIAPDYTTYTVATRDGQVYSGVARAEGPDLIKVTDTNAKVATVRRGQIQEFRPGAASIMPPGLASALGDSAVRDLIAYLTSPAPPGNPPPR